MKNVLTGIMTIALGVIVTLMGAGEVGVFLALIGSAPLLECMKATRAGRK